MCSTSRCDVGKVSETPILTWTNVATATASPLVDRDFADRPAPGVATNSKVENTRPARLSSVRDLGSVDSPVDAGCYWAEKVM